MRRLLVAAASGAVLLLGAGCSTATGTADPAVTPGLPTGLAASAGAAGDAALAANVGAICNQAVKVSGTATTGFLEAQKDLANGGPKAAEYASQLLENVAFALKDIANLAADQPLKEAFNSAAAEAEKLSKGDPKTVTEAQLAAVRAPVEKACAGK